MNASENFSSRILPTENSHQHRHYTRVVLVISILVILAIAAFFIVRATHSGTKGGALRLSDEGLKESQAFFTEHPPTNEPMTDAEKKEISEFFAKNKSTQ